MCICIYTHIHACIHILSCGIPFRHLSPGAPRRPAPCRWPPRGSPRGGRRPSRPSSSRRCLSLLLYILSCIILITLFYHYHYYHSLSLLLSLLLLLILISILLLVLLLFVLALDDSVPAQREAQDLQLYHLCEYMLYYHIMYIYIYIYICGSMLLVWIKYLNWLLTAWGTGPPPLAFELWKSKTFLRSLTSIIEDNSLFINERR